LKRKSFFRSVAMLLIVVMCISLLPMTAFADGLNYTATATAMVAEGQSDYGTATAEFVENIQDDKSLWLLTATPAANYRFSSWESGGETVTSAIYNATLTVDTEYIAYFKENTAPVLKSDVSSTVAEITAGSAYELDLSTIFEDADGDPLMYQVSVDNAEPVTVDESYSYTQSEAGEYTLTFTANDGDVTSETYTIMLMVTAGAGEEPSIGMSTEEPAVAESATPIMLLGIFPTSAWATEQLATIQYTGEYHDSAGVRFSELDYDTWNSLNQTEFSTISSDGCDGQVFVGLSSLSAGYQLLGWKVKLGNATEFTEYTGDNSNYFDITGEVDDVCHWVGTPDTLSSFLENMLGLPSSICNNLYGGIFVYSISNTPVVIEPIIGIVSSDASELTIATDSMTNGSASKSNVGDLYTLTAKPANGYMLDYWEYSTDGGGTYPEENRIINDDQNTKANITVTLTEDRVYRASFKPAHILLLDKPIVIRQWHWIEPRYTTPFEVDKYFIGSSTGSEPPQSDLVREGLDATLGIYIDSPSLLPREIYTGKVDLYKNKETKEPFRTIEFRRGETIGSTGRGHISLLIEDIPYMDSITAKITITYKDSGITTTSTRHYEFSEGVGIERDDAGQARFDALANLKEYYKTNFSEKMLDEENKETSHNRTEPVADGDGAYTTYDSFSAVRYLLRYAYEDAFNEIRWVSKTAQDVETDYNAAIARFEAYAALNNEILAGKGEAYKDVDGVIKVLFYHNVGTGNIPSFAYVPADSVVRDAVEAGMENYNPRNWTINGGKFFTSMNTQAGDGYVKPGGWSSQIIYSRNHAWAVGVADEKITDRDILIFGNTITPNQYVTLKDLPKKQELTWALGILAEKYELSQLKENTTFVNALNLAYNWGVNGEGTVGVPLYPADLDAAQGAVDNALTNLMAAYPDVVFTRYDMPEPVLNVISLIRAIGNVDPQSGDKIEAARNAYDALEALTYKGTDYTKEQVQALVSNYDVLVAAEVAYGHLSTSAGQAADVLGAALPELQSSYNETPLTGSIGGEWAVFGIARGGRDVTETTTKYLGKLNALLTEKGLDEIGTSKYTEYSRIVLALSSLGIDAQNYSYAGQKYNFISKLTEFDNVTKQGINGPIFALLALDSKPYLSENTELRGQYVSYILDRQHNDGGWSLDDTKSEPSDTDVTAMVLQALSNYKKTEGVSTAISSGLATLKTMQDTTYGGFYSSGAYNSESTAQVIVALTALDIDPTNEDWTVEGGKDPVTALLSFYISDSKTFRHVLNGGADGMATEQAVNALTALDRFNKGSNSLYDMSDMFDDTPEGVADKTGLRDAITMTLALRLGDYTTASWDALQDALTAAQAVNGDADTDQETVDNARAGLLAAIGALEYVGISVNKSVLVAAIAIGDELTEEDYTSPTWDKMWAALSAAEVVAADTDAEQEAVDAVADNLLTTLIALERAPHTKLLDEAIAKTGDISLALTEADYTPATWAAYSSTLTVAQAVYADAAQDEIDFAVQELIASIGNLEAAEGSADQEYGAVTALLTAIKGALTADDYIPATWSALDDAQDKTALTNALLGLVLESVLDFDDLTTIVTQAELLTASDFTEDSYSPFAEAVYVRASKQLQGQDHETQKEIDDNASAILTAMKGLALSNVPGQVNKVILHSLITQATALQASRYTLESWQALETALTAAQSTYENPEATQVEVDTAKNELLTAIGALETVVDKTALNSAITQARGITNVGKEYTIASWTSLQNALEYALSVFENLNATQVMVDSAYRDLLAAIEGLTKNTGGGGTLPPTPTSSYAYISVTDPGATGSQTKTYFARKKYELSQGETAYSILQRTGLTLRVSTHPKYAGVYVEAINGFGEFDAGPLSGWMYKVNGEFPGYSASLYMLKDNDEVEWVYTRDLGKNVGNVWDSGSGGVDVTNTTVSPSATVSGNTASVTLSLNTMKDAIAGAKTSGKDIVVIPEIKGSVKTVKVDLAKDALSAISTQKSAALTIQTPVGNVTISNDALASVASQASGNMVTMSLELVDTSSLTPAQQEAVGDKPVYDISIMSGSSHISSFDGKSITISLPYTLQEGESVGDVKVWYLNDAGELEQIDCTYDEKAGLATFKTSHLSYYLVGVEAAKDDFVINFTDVKESDWFYEAVKFAVENGLFKGTTETTFSPSQPMTRAMLVTVLHRLEGSPAATGANNFTDVKNGEWYTNAVIWANANDIVSGYGNGLFGTNDPITREQMAAILYRYAGYKGYNVTAVANLSAYTDAAAISSWAEKAMSWANAEGLITGRTTTTLVSGGTATRAEVASILKRFVEGFVE